MKGYVIYQRWTGRGKPTTANWHYSRQDKCWLRAYAELHVRPGRLTRCLRALNAGNLCADSYSYEYMEIEAWF